MTTLLKMVILFALLAGPAWVRAEPPAPAGKVPEGTRLLVEQELAVFAGKLSVQKDLDSETATGLLRGYMEEHLIVLAKSRLQ